jgi:excisionase family DNA binding protein
MPKQAQAAQARQLSTIQEAAHRYHVHPDTIRRRIADGELTGYRFGARLLRVDLAEVDALLRPIPTVRPSDGGRAA